MLSACLDTPQVFSVREWIDARTERLEQLKKTKHVLFDSLAKEMHNKKSDIATLLSGIFECAMDIALESLTQVNMMEKSMEELSAQLGNALERNIQLHSQLVNMESLSMMHPHTPYAADQTDLNGKEMRTSTASADSDTKDRNHQEPFLFPKLKHHISSIAHFGRHSHPDHAGDHLLAERIAFDCVPASNTSSCQPLSPSSVLSPTFTVTPCASQLSPSRASFPEVHFTTALMREEKPSTHKIKIFSWFGKNTKHPECRVRTNHVAMCPKPELHPQVAKLLICSFLDQLGTESSEWTIARTS